MGLLRVDARGGGVSCGNDPMINIGRRVRGRGDRRPIPFRAGHGRATITAPTCEPGRSGPGSGTDRDSPAAGGPRAQQPTPAPARRRSPAARRLRWWGERRHRNRGRRERRREAHPGRRGGRPARPTRPPPGPAPPAAGAPAAPLLRSVGIAAGERGRETAALIAASRPGASAADFAIAERELEETISAQTNTLANLRAVRGVDVSSPGGGDQ